MASPATMILPSERMWPEYATSLKREMVLETVRVLEEKSLTRVEEVIAKSCGARGEKWIFETEPYSWIRRGDLKDSQ